MTECIFTFPEVDVLKNWQSIQDYACKSLTEIEWDEHRRVLVARGVSCDPRRILDDIAGIMYNATDEFDGFTWDQNWECRIQLGLKFVRLLIIGDPADSLLSLNRAKMIATEYLSRKLPEWMQLILDQIYPVYVKRFCEGTTFCRTDYFNVLRINDCIAYCPESNQYELYVAADPLINTHLIHLVEIEGTPCEIELERCT